MAARKNDMQLPRFSNKYQQVEDINQVFEIAVMLSIFFRRKNTTIEIPS